MLGIIAPSEQHLLAAAPGRHKTDADLYQTHIGFRMGFQRIAMQQDLAATAERHTGRRADDRKRRKLEVFVDILTLFDRLRNLWPCCDVGCEKRKTDIGAHGEIGSLVVDHQGFVTLGRNDLQCLGRHHHDAFVHSVHL